MLTGSLHQSWSHPDTTELHKQSFITKWLLKYYLLFLFPSLPVFSRAPVPILLLEVLN